MVAGSEGVDTSRIQINKLSEIINNREARMLREKIRKSNVNEERIAMVYSKDSEGSTVTSAAMIGYSLSAYVLCSLANQPFNYYVIEDVKQNNYLKNYQQLKKNWMKSEVEVDIDDIEFIAREIYE